MRLPIVIRYTGVVLIFISFFMLISAGVSWIYNDAGLFILIYSASVAFIFGIFPLIFVPPAKNIENMEGYLIVVFSWIFSCIIGMLPFLLWGGEFNTAKSLFESISGYTTTGATSIANIESLPRGILFWRMLTHFIGGIGIVVFALVVLPSIGTAKVTLYKREMSSMAMDNFQYRARMAMQILLYVYLGLTVLLTTLLMIAGMDLYDAITHSFATIATGGFSTRNASVAAFDSIPIEILLMIFMMISGLHFGLIFSTVSGGKNKIWQSSVARFYIFAQIIGISIVAISLYGKNYETWGESIRYAAFQVISLGTSTGFANADSANWPPVAMLAVIFFSLVCACSGSTSGGIKVDRIVIFIQAIIKELRQMIHPNAIITVKLDNTNKSNEVEAAMTFIVLYLVSAFLSTLLICSFGVDILSSFTAVVACLGNAGPGFGLVSSMSNFGTLPDAALYVLSFDMLLGRFELYGLLVLFMFRAYQR